MQKRISLLLAAALLFPVLAWAHAYKLGSIGIEHPWSSATPPNAGVAGGYLTIKNNGKKNDVFLGGSTTEAVRVEIHQMTTENGVMRMRPLASGLPVPAGKGVSLAPGGYHLMFIKPKQQWKDGDRIPVVLQFKHAGKIKVEFAVHAEKPGSTKHSHH